MKKRIFSLLTTLVLVVSLVGVVPAVTASAMEYADVMTSLSPSEGYVKSYVYDEGGNWRKYTYDLNGNRTSYEDSEPTLMHINQMEK